MKIKKILMLLFCAGIIGGALMGGPRQAHAQDTTAPKTTFFEGLVQMIAQKFNLNKNAVQSVVNDYQQQHKTKMQQNMQQRDKNRLDALVKAGKITAAQEQAILNEQATLKTKYNLDNMKHLTKDQRKQQMQNMQNDINTWAKSQGIDPKYVFGGFGMGMRMKGEMHKMQGWPTPTP